jgi:undecaprenyl diphosphate synthase
LNDPKIHWHQPDPSRPQHVAIIMDGNGRWARQRGLPRSLGHDSGARVVRSVVEHCAAQGIGHLTLFAFSSENWKRPEDEVSKLMGLFTFYLEKEVREMERSGVRLKIIGDRSRFAPRLQELIAQAERATAQNDRIVLHVAANYGGRWDMVEAVRRWQLAHPGQTLSSLTEQELAPYLSLADAPEPDLLIRTGGESRISNFLLWQAAYAELYFSDVLWPDFSVQELDRALAWFAGKDRRFGAVSGRVAS